MNNKGNAQRFIFNLLLYRFKKTYTYNRRMFLEILIADNIRNYGINTIISNK